MPTPKLERNLERKLNIIVVSLTSRRFSAENSGEKSKMVADEIKEQLKELRLNRYKIIVRFLPISSGMPIGLWTETPTIHSLSGIQPANWPLPLWCIASKSTSFT